MFLRPKTIQLFRTEEHPPSEPKNSGTKDGPLSPIFDIFSIALPNMAVHCSFKTYKMEI
jgi:hypothetical protein